MVKRLVLSVLILILVVPFLPSEVQQSLGLSGLTGIIVILLGLLLVEWTAKVIGHVRGPRVKGGRRQRRRNVEHHPRDYPAQQRTEPVQHYPPPQQPAPAPEEPPTATDSPSPPGQPSPTPPRPVRHPPRLSRGPN